MYIVIADVDMFSLLLLNRVGANEYAALIIATDCDWRYMKANFSEEIGHPHGVRTH